MANVIVVACPKFYSTYNSCVYLVFRCSLKFLYDFLISNSNVMFSSLKQYFCTPLLTKRLYISNCISFNVFKSSPILASVIFVACTEFYSMNVFVCLVSYRSLCDLIHQINFIIHVLMSLAEAWISGWYNKNTVPGRYTGNQICKWQSAAER